LNRRESRINPQDGLKIKKSDDVVSIVCDSLIDAPLAGETLETLEGAIPRSMISQSVRRHA
jgi:hypothetical protein